MRSLVTRDISVLERANADRARASRFSARTNHGWSRAAQQSIPVSSLPVRATSFAIEYRDDDNKSQITREDGTVIAYDYDDAKRLIEEKWTASDQTVLHHFQYTYDAAGNRLTKDYNGTTTDYDYNSLNQLTQEQTGGDVAEYGYDRDGNTIRKVEPSKTTWYSWDHENMLTKAEFSDATPTNYFSYDVDSVRVEKVDSEGRAQMHSDRLEVLVKRSGADVDMAVAHGHAPFRGVGSQVLRTAAAGEYAYHHDFVGSVSEITDESQNEARQTTRDAFGVVLLQSGGLADPFEFLGREGDDDVDLLHLGRRVYSPSTGRFLSRDPISEVALTSGMTVPLPGPAHLYVYAQGNPVRLADPFGLEDFTFDLPTSKADHALDVYDKRRRFAGKIRYSGSSVENRWTWAGVEKSAEKQYGFRRNAQLGGTVLKDLRSAVGDTSSAAYKWAFGVLEDGLKGVEETTTPTPRMVRRFVGEGRIRLGSGERLELVVGEAARVEGSAQAIAEAAGLAGRAVKASRFIGRVGGKFIKILMPVVAVLTFESELQAAQGDVLVAAKRTAIRTGRDLVFWDEAHWLIGKTGQVIQISQRQFSAWVARQSARVQQAYTKRAGFDVWTNEVKNAWEEQ